MRKSNFALIWLITIVLFSGAYAAAAQNPKENGIIGIKSKQNIRVVYDVKDNLLDAGIGKGLYYVRGLLQSYQALGIAQQQRHISVVLHGKAAYMLLKDEAYQNHTLDPFAVNPNTKIVDELLSQGVSVEICYATMKGRGWTADDILPGVTIVHDAYTRLIDLQQRGYAYIRF